MKIPISNLLRKRGQEETATLQDEIVTLSYSLTEDLVLHGETAIWRCFSGRRFSSDLNLYSSSFPSLSSDFKKQINSKNLNLIKFKDTRKVIYSSISNGRTSVELEINHAKKIGGVRKEYEMVDGTTFEVYCLTAEQLIIEKINAYNNRRFVRDLYDIFYLTNLVDDISPIKSDLEKFIENLQKPIDESLLRSIVYVGLPPTFDQMESEIRRLVR